ncbi:MAG: magnesium transporter MgtE N-terminal domain-containing protein [Beijerinckiaceae bacterium]
MTFMQSVPDPIYMLSDLIGGRARLHGKTIGKLTDIVVAEQGKLPEVTHLLIDRPFGHKSLMVPWSKVDQLSAKGGTILTIESPELHEDEPREGQICLRDHLLDKKVLDCDEDEVEVVYDIKLTARNGKLYVTDVDCSRAGFLRRIGLTWLSNLIRGVAAKLEDDKTIPWTYVQALPADMSSFKGNVKLNVLKEKLPEMHPVDLADILEELEPEQRLAIFSELDTEQASDTLEEVEPRVQRELVSALTVERVAELVSDMTPGQAADLVAVLPNDDMDAILERIDAADAAKIRALIEKHEERIVDFATAHCISFPPTATVGEVMVKYRDVAKNADVVMYIYVLDATGVLLGVIDIKELLQAESTDKLEDIMVTNVVSLDENSTVADASKLFARYSFRAIPIIGEGEVMKGAIPYRDIMQLEHRFV